MMALGPSHLTAARSSSVSLWCLAHRTKFPALWWPLVWSSVSQLSRSPCRALRRVRWWAASQSSSVMAALTCCWTAVAWPWVGGGTPPRCWGARPAFVGGGVGGGGGGGFFFGGARGRGKGGQGGFGGRP